MIEGREIKEDVFIGPQITAMLKDEESETKLNNLGKRTWASIILVHKKFC